VTGTFASPPGPIGCTACPVGARSIDRECGCDSVSLRARQSYDIAMFQFTSFRTFPFIAMPRIPYNQSYYCTITQLLSHCLLLTNVFGNRYSDWLRAERPVLGPTQPPIQWVPKTLSPESGRDLMLTTHLKLVPRLRKCGSIHPLPHTPSWRSA
jgi:hypothetical protein